jgi:hypothetical protein
MTPDENSSSLRSSDRDSLAADAANKDLEIARLRGKVEALEGELAKERAMRAMQPPVPTIMPAPLPFDPLIPPVIYNGTRAPPPVIYDGSICALGANAANPMPLGTRVWVGETCPSLESIAALSRGQIATIS